MIFLDTDIISFYHFAVKNVVDKVMKGIFYETDSR